MKHASAFGRSFDYLMLLPLVAYLLLIGGLLAAVFFAITPEALRAALSDPALLDALWLSLVTSCTSTILAIAVAIPAGYVLARCRFPGHSLADTILDMPIVLPTLVMGLSVLIFFNTGPGRWIDREAWAGTGWQDGLFVFQPLGIVLVQFIVGGAFAVRVIKSGFDSLDVAYEQVAHTLGANRWQTFFRVTLPCIMPSLIAGAVISWARIFGLFGPVLLVAGTMRSRTEILPTTIFLETSVGRIEVALVVGALMILISTAVLMLFKKLGGRGYLW